MSTIDFDGVLLAPLYAVLGVDAVITVAGNDYDIVVIDKTAGVEVGGNVEVPTVVPAAAVQYATLTGVGLSAADTVDASISFHGFTWTVYAYKLDPNPSGERSGEVMLLLKEPHELTSSSG